MRQPCCLAMLTAVMACVAIGFPAYGDSATAQTEAKSTSPNAVTVIGCVRTVDQMAVGTSGSSDPAAGATAPANRSANDSSIKFLLTNATQKSGPVQTASTRASRSRSSANGYRLDADEGKLTPHVGQQVEISGTIENPGSPSPVGDTVFSGAPRLKVDAVRTVATACR